MHDRDNRCEHERQEAQEQHTDLLDQEKHRLTSADAECRSGRPEGAGADEAQSGLAQIRAAQ